MRAADNPFAVHYVLRQRYRLTKEDWTRLLERLAALRYRAAIVGPPGSGKTTLLEDLAVRLEGLQRRVRLIQWSSANRRMPDLSGIERDEVLLCDGAEQLSRFDWWRLLLQSRRAGGLVITTQREGLLPTLHRCKTSPALLHDLVSSLGVPLDGGRCIELYELVGGNMRDALRVLYDEVSVQ